MLVRLSMRMSTPFTVKVLEFRTLLCQGTMSMAHRSMIGVEEVVRWVFLWFLVRAIVEGAYSSGFCVLL